jgi:hypothetical protein
MGEPTSSIEDSYRLADIRSDDGDYEAARAINFCAGRAAQYREWLEKLAWACADKSSRKRSNSLAIVLAEMDAAGESKATMSWPAARAALSKTPGRGE